MRSILQNLKKALLVVAAVLVSGSAAAGTPGCVGKMWNPLTDLDYRLMGGIKVMGIKMMQDPKHLGAPPKHKAPQMCACKDGLNSGVGFTLTFWMPSYINDVARQAGCLGFLNGINILPGFMSLSSGQEYNRHEAGKDGVTNMQVHWAYADVTAVAGKALFERCNAVTGSMKISYLTEPDFIFQNDVYSAIMTPHVAILAASPLLSQMVCGFEAMANTLGDWRDIGVCAWRGTRLPLTANAIAKDSAQVTNMDVTLKYLTRSALLGTTLRTMGEDAICKPKHSPFYDPFQHRYQWSFPDKVSTRYNVDVIRWGMFNKDSGGVNMQQLASQASSLSSTNTTNTTASGGALNAARQVLAKIPKPLNYPTREAGYMQVWEARQCCLIVLTIKKVLEMVATSFIGGGGLLEQLYNYYNMANKIYQVVTDPIGAALDFIGEGIMNLAGSAVSGISESLGFGSGGGASSDWMPIGTEQNPFVDGTH